MEQEDEIIQFKNVKCCMCDRTHFQCYICYQMSQKILCDYILKTQRANYCKRCETFNLFCQNLIHHNICFISLQNLQSIYYDNINGHLAQQIQSNYIYQTNQNSNTQQQRLHLDRNQLYQFQINNNLQITQENNQNMDIQQADIYQNIEEQDTILDEDLDTALQNNASQVTKAEDLDDSFILSSISIVGALSDVNQNQNQNSLEEWNNQFDFIDQSFMKNENSFNEEMSRLQFEIQIDLSQLNITKN